jgi:hypothetical protein
VPCTTLKSPWLLCRRGFAKTFDEWIAKDSPQSEQAAEAGFGELQYLDEALLKAGAHYTGIAGKSEDFFLGKYAEYPSVTGFAQIHASVYFAQGPGLLGTVLKRFTFQSGSSASILLNAQGPPT